MGGAEAELGGGGGKGAGRDGGGCDVLGIVGKVGATAEVLSIVAHPNMIVECLDEKLKDSPLAHADFLVSKFFLERDLGFHPDQNTPRSKSPSTPFQHHHPNPPTSIITSGIGPRPGP